MSDLSDILGIVGPTLLMGVIVGLWRAIRLLFEIREDGRENKRRLTLINGSLSQHLLDHTQAGGLNERLTMAVTLAAARHKEGDQ